MLPIDRSRSEKDVADSGRIVGQGKEAGCQIKNFMLTSRSNNKQKTKVTLQGDNSKRRQEEATMDGSSKGEKGASQEPRGARRVSGIKF